MTNQPVRARCSVPQPPKKHQSQPLPQRRSIRLKGYDYSQVGAYFITICAHNRQKLFGEIENGEMRLNEFGEIVQEEWLKTPAMRHNIETDEFIIMPNHFHGILIINPDNGATVGARCIVPLQRNSTHVPLVERFGKPTSNSIPSIIRGIKSAITKRVNVIRNTPGFPVFQRNYYEHVIRNDGDLNRIREYIINNPANWETDDGYTVVP